MSLRVRTPTGRRFPSTTTRCRRPICVIIVQARSAWKLEGTSPFQVLQTVHQRATNESVPALQTFEAYFRVNVLRMMWKSQGACRVRAIVDVGAERAVRRVHPAVHERRRAHEDLRGRCAGARQGLAAGTELSVCGRPEQSFRASRDTRPVRSPAESTTGKPWWLVASAASTWESTEHADRMLSCYYQCNVAT